MMNGETPDTMTAEESAASLKFDASLPKKEKAWKTQWDVDTSALYDQHTKTAR